MKKFTRYFDYVRPCIWHLAAAIVFGVLFGLTSGFGMPVIFDKVLRNIFLSQERYSFAAIVGIAALLPLVFAVRAVTGYLSGFLMSYTSLEVLRRLKQDIFSHVQDYPIAFFDKYTTGDLLVRLSNDTSAVQTILLSFSSEIFRQPLQVVGALAFLAYLSWTNGEIVFLLVFIAAVPFCIVPVQLIRKNLKRSARQAQNFLGQITQLFNENLDAAHEIRVFNLEESQKDKFAGLNLAFQNFSLKIAKYELVQQPFMELLAATMVAVTFVYAYFAKIDFPTFAAIGLALYFTIDPIKRIVRMSSDFIKTMPLFDRINEVLDYVSTVPEPENPVEIGRLRGEIEFDGVSFSYGDKPVLKNVNVRIPAGTSCALVGESGAGKSTFAKLAMRLYDPCSGCVKADGIALNKMRRRDYVENIGSVPQYPVLFNDTVMNNIRLARPEASDAEVYEAAKKAYAHDFITELENGYDTIVGERGDKLSGGQKQRIAIARVFLKNPPLVFLDEATSALDANSEAFIQKALDEMMRDKTVLIIAHRFSTIRNAKKVIVFRDGEVIDVGSHSELMLRCPYYATLYERQTRNMNS